jgi:hypothetical protein
MLKRSGFARKVYEPAPRAPIVPGNGRGVIRPVGDVVVAMPKGIKAKPGKRTPTALEADWIIKAVAFGCVACWLDGTPSRPTAYHHIVDGNRRLGHLFGFGLCDPGHHQHGQQFGLVSRHPWKARFEQRYGSEFDLLARLKTQLGVFDEAEYRT